MEVWVRICASSWNTCFFVIVCGDRTTKLIILTFYLHCSSWSWDASSSMRKWEKWKDIVRGSKHGISRPGFWRNWTLVITQPTSVKTFEELCPGFAAKCTKNWIRVAEIITSFWRHIQNGLMENWRLQSRDRWNVDQILAFVHRRIQRI